MTQLTQLTQPNTVGRGNTKTLPTNNSKKKVKDTRSRKYCLTLNNYTDHELTQLTHTFNTKEWKYIIGKEVGEQGTPHLQIYIECKNAVKFKTIKGINNRLHIEITKGDRRQNIIYCSKDNNYITTFQDKDWKSRKELILNDEYNDFIPRPFQKEILDILASSPDKRKIYWFYERDGNVGKSYLTKYIALSNEGVVIADGKKADIFNNINELIKSNIEPSIILLDIPRYNQEYINYGAIEQIKNGCIYSGKYEGGLCLFKIPHIIIFSNDLPDMDKWSKDRYEIRRIMPL
jgi:hypothetical protein